MLKCQAASDKQLVHFASRTCSFKKNEFEFEYDKHTVKQFWRVLFIHSAPMCLAKKQARHESCVKMASDLGQETICGKLNFNFMFSIADRKILNAFPKYYVVSLTLGKVRAVLTNTYKCGSKRHGHFLRTTWKCLYVNQPCSYRLWLAEDCFCHL